MLELLIGILSLLIAAAIGRLVLLPLAQRWLRARTTRALEVVRAVMRRRPDMRILSEHPLKLGFLHRAEKATLELALPAIQSDSAAHPSGLRQEAVTAATYFLPDNAPRLLLTTGSDCEASWGVPITPPAGYPPGWTILAADAAAAQRLLTPTLRDAVGALSEVWLGEVALSLHDRRLTVQTAGWLTRDAELLERCIDRMNAVADAIRDELDRFTGTYRNAPPTLAALTLALITSGCALSTPGELGRLEFRILVDDAVGGSSEITALAPDTEVVVRVTRAGGRAALLTDFRVDQPWVVAVSRESQDALRIKSLVIGDARLFVRAGGEDDLIHLNVLTPVAARVWGPATSARELPLALHGETGSFPLTLSGPGGRRVLALGVMPPIRVVPEGAATITLPKAREGTVMNVTFERPGVVRLEGDLEPALSVRVLADGELDSLELDRDKIEQAQAPSALRFRLRGVVAGKRGDIVSSGARVTIDTPAVCAEASEETGAIRALIPGSVVIQALIVGRCTGTVTFAGKSAAFSEGVVPQPSAQR